MSNHHIIVGDGITAAEFATTRQTSAGDRITIIGPDVANLGRGVAYAKAPPDALWRYAYLLNSPARSVDQAFGEWMSGNWETIVQRMSARTPDWLSAAQHYVEQNQIESLNAPREIYGDFFHNAVLEKLNALREQQVDIQLLPTRVNHIESSGNTFSVTTEDGQRLNADSVDVATGGPQNQRFEGDDDQFSFPGLYGHEADIAAQLGDTGNIICIGAGASMLDLLRFCQSVQTESEINLTAISTGGTVMEALRPASTFNPAHYELTGTYACADDFLSAVKQLQQNALDSGHNFYETRVGLRSLFMKTSLIEFVPDITEARKVAVPLFNHFQGGTRDSIDDFNRLLTTGNTNIIAGRVQKINCDHNGATITYNDAAGRTYKRSANVVVNCAGPGRDNRFDTLTNKMLEQNWMSICQQSGGILVGDNAQTSIAGIRYLGPAVTSIGNSVQPVPLYDAFRLRLAVQQFNKISQD